MWIILLRWTSSDSFLALHLELQSRFKIWYFYKPTEVFFLVVIYLIALLAHLSLVRRSLHFNQTTCSPTMFKHNNNPNFPSWPLYFKERKIAPERRIFLHAQCARNLTLFFLEVFFHNIIFSLRIAVAVLIEGFWKDFDIPTYNDQCACMKRSCTIKGTVELL
jgi:hypothetical protein